MNLLLNLLGLRGHLSDHLVNSRNCLGKTAIMTLYLLEVDLFFKLERRGEKKWKTNLVHQSGNGVLEFLGDIDEKVDIMSSMGFDGTLGTNSSQVSFAVGVNLVLRMLLALENPGCR